MTNHQDLSDAELFAASVATTRLFGAVFDRHAPEILRYLTRRVGAQDAEDLLSQTFLVALERRASFDHGAESARPWLYGIASNLLLRRQRDEVRFLRALARVPGEPPEASFEESAAERVDARSESASLATALAALAADDRNVLLLVVWADLSHQQIAHALAIPVGTVKSRAHRARQQLRRHLEPSTSLERTPRNG